MKEDKLDMFGKHPAYQKEPMELPSNDHKEMQDYYDMNDESVENEQPYGQQIGDSAPFEIDPKAIENAIAESIKRILGNKKKNLNEKHVIKVPKSNPMPPMPMEEPNMGGQDPMMGDEQPMDNQMMDGEMGEENDPKKEIQQLSGKLSQELRNYNNDQQTPDTDLNKYVAGMVIPQATKVMTSDEKAEVINKIKKGMTDDDLETDVSNEDMGGNEGMDMPMESKINLDNIIN